MILTQTLTRSSSTIWENYKHPQSSHLRDMETEAQGGEVTCSRLHSWFMAEPELELQASESWSVILPYLSLGTQKPHEFLESSTWPFHICILIIKPSSWNLSSQVPGDAQQIFNEWMTILSGSINSELWWTLYIEPMDYPRIIRPKVSLSFK